MGYAEVSVNSPVSRRQSFSYAIPPGLSVAIGQAVFVPFGAKTLQGIVVELTELPAVEQTKDISGVIESKPLLSSAQIGWAKWLSEYYLAPLWDCVSLMLPPGFERRVLTFFALSPNQEYDKSALTPDQLKVLEMIKDSPKTGLKELEKQLGQRKARNITNQLLNNFLLVRTYEFEPVRVKPKLVPCVNLLVSPAEALAESGKLPKRAAKQAVLLELLAGENRVLPLAEIRKITGITSAALKKLAERKLVEIKEIEVRREPLAGQQLALSLPLALTNDQLTALNTIKTSLQTGKPDVFLLHGVTGSGKTEVYLQALAEAVRQGKRGIVLVPEISLTPQTIERFAARFPNRVAVLHSRLSLGEQFDEWQRIRNGEFDVVIGPRSALFAPQPDLGLIVIDEEHEWNYKQTENSPRYHTRDTAVKFGELTGATVVLGSATPDVESYYHALNGDYKLLQLPERVTPVAGWPLPEVEIVDLKQELLSGNRSIFSRALEQNTKESVARGEQVLFFLNRRGGATFVQCRRCGFVMRCKRCDVSLTYHSDENSLVCHQCNRRTPVPAVCPRCASPRIKYVGIGTQKLEESAAAAFPEARLLRWDSDVTRQKHSHTEILDKFRSHQADILIGTQMIAKGLDLPLVTLVGVINADISLNLPDFRAGERTFQLLSQVAGRAGRGFKGGKVVVQTYEPENYAVRAAAKHDYRLFYETEIAYRKQLNNPPFTRLVSLTFTHPNDNRCREEAERLKKVIETERDARGLADVGIIGPAPAFIQRLRGRYRRQMIIRGNNPAKFLGEIDIPRGWIIDVDPVGI